MHETWDLINNITEVIGMIAIPICSWVIYTLVQQGKQIIVLEQKVNESLNQRLDSLEQRVGSLEDKIDQISESITECRMLVNDQRNLHTQISEKFDILIAKIKRAY